MSTDPESNDRANGSAAPADGNGTAPGSGNSAAPTAGGSTAADAAANGSPSFAGPATATEEPPAESQLAPEDSGADGDASAAAAGAEDGAVSAPAPVTRTPGILSAEMFSVAGAFALLGSLIGTRLVELAASVTAASQEGMIKTMAAGDGVFALVAVVLSGASLVAAGPGTRTWVRWVSGAVLLVGVLLVATAAATYFLVPPPAPPQPMVPGMGG